MMEVSTQGRLFVESWEGFSGTAYLCPAGVWTIGYGHTQGVKAGDVWTKAQADSMLRSDLALFGNEVTAAIGNAYTDQQEYDAMVSLAFNIGIGGFRSSSVLRLHKDGKKDAAAKAFGLWNKAIIGGVLQPVEGLTRRRAAEASLYLTPDAAVDLITVPLPQVASEEMPQKVEPPKTAAQSKTVIAGGVSVAAGAATVADQINQVTPVIDSITTAGASLHSLLKLGGLALSVIALCAVGYMLWRYIQKRRAGDVVST